jgi:hypothetical protein
MTQVDFNDHWLFILKEIIQPIQQKLYTGYFSDVGHQETIISFRMILFVYCD